MSWFTGFLVLKYARKIAKLANWIANFARCQKGFLSAEWQLATAVDLSECDCMSCASSLFIWTHYTLFLKQAATWHTVRIICQLKPTSYLFTLNYLVIFSELLHVVRDLVALILNQPISDQL